MTAGQVAELIASAGVFWGPPIAVAAGTGLPFGELFGLARRDIDPLHRQLRVRRQLTEVAGHPWISEDLKTVAARRTVTLPVALADRIAEHMARWHNDSGLMFTTVDGAMVRRSNFARRVLRPAAKAAGLPPGFTFHRLRHTHASLLLAAGEPFAQVSRRLGHGNVGVTMRTYAHYMPGAEWDAADRWDALMAGVESRGAEVQSLRG